MVVLEGLLRPPTQKVSGCGLCRTSRLACVCARDGQAALNRGPGPAMMVHFLIHAAAAWLPL